MIDVTVRAAGDRDDATALHCLALGLAGAIETRVAEHPFLIEIAGTPRAGKTTVLRRLARTLRGRNLRVAMVGESASGCPIPDKRSPKFNVWTFCAMLQRVLEAQYAGADVVLVDRGIVDVLCWMEWYCAIGFLTVAEHRGIEPFVLHPLWAEAIDLVLVMTADPEVATWRDRRYRAAPGQIVNPDTLAQFNASIDRVHRRLESEYPLVALDTTRLQPDEVLHRLMAAALARC